LKTRVRSTLGISDKKVADAAVDPLDPFFSARNKIAHEMDLEDPSSSSIKRVHSNPSRVANQSSEAFSVAVALINGGASVCKAAGV
jgi:hypothetical protein